MNIFQPITFLLMATMRHSSYNARDKAKKWEEKAEMQEKRLVIKLERHFISVETASSKHGILRGNALLETLCKGSVLRKKDGNSTQRSKFSIWTI